MQDDSDLGRRINLGLVFGGKSMEHDVSILSAKSIYESINVSKFDISLIYVTKQGKFVLLDKLDEFPSTSQELESVSFREVFVQFDSNIPFFYIDDGVKRGIHIDIIFPITHGTLGEDGSMQGFFKIIGVPFVGCDVLSSALCMDKETMKKLLVASGVPVAPFISYTILEKDKISYDDVVDRLGLPLFVKPARQGSSVGVSKVSDLSSFKDSISKAFLFDTKILIEKAILGMELECAIVGNDEAYISTIGEVNTRHEFYSYEAKYLDPEGTKLTIPAPNITGEEMELIKKVCLRAYKALYCEGFARVDLFYSDGNVFVNEINTLPGFTKTSMFPKLWEYHGVKLSQLLEMIIDLSMCKESKRTVK